MRIGGVIAALVEAALPAPCIHCGGLLAGSEQTMCRECRTALVPAAGLRCPRCGVPGPADETSCLSCQRAAPPQRATVVWGEYDGPLRSALLALKHHGHDELAPVLGGRLAALVSQYEWAVDVSAVVSIPSHPLRRLRRGPSAADALADVTAEVLARPRPQLLRRHGRGRQAERTRAQRLALRADAFQGRSSDCPESVLVIDDVLTTGSTLRRAAEALYRSGVSTVYCAAMAYTPDSRRPT